MEINELFKTILGMTMVASATIIAVLLIRVVMDKLKLATKWKYILWIVVLFRLLCPISITTPISPMQDSATVYQRVHSVADKAVSARKQANEQADEQAIKQTDSVKESLAQEPFKLEVPAIKAIPAKQQSSILDQISPQMVIGMIWLLGIIGMLAYATISSLRLKKRLVGSVKYRDNIYECDYISTAFVKGVFKPVIYIPSSLDEKEREYVILHEMTHIRRADPFSRMLAYAALSIHWFNPLCWIAFLVSETDMEMSCDERVIGKIETDIRANYARAIFDMALGRQYSLQMPLSFGKGNTKERIVNIMKRKNNNKILTVAVAPVIATLLIACGTNSARPSAGDALEPATEAATEAATESTTEEAKKVDAKEAMPTTETETEYESLTGEEAEALKADLEKWANDEATYGFLLSTYDDVRDCDYGEVFYNGAGIAVTPTKEEDAAVTKYYTDKGEENPEIDLTLVKKADMDKFLMEKVGITSDDISEGKQFGVYLDSIKAYFFLHGDTNSVSFECTEVAKDGDNIVASFNIADGSSSKAVFEKTENGYRILKNEYTR